MEFMDIVYILLLFAGLALELTLILLGMHIGLASVITAIFLCLVNPISLSEGLTIYWEGVGDSAASYWATFLGLPIFSTVMVRTNSSTSLANGLAKILNKVARKEKIKRTLTIIICVLFTVLLTYGGISIIAAMLLLIPLYSVVFSKCDIPREYITAVIALGVSVACVGPGTPSLYNSIPAEFMGTSSTAGLIPGIMGQVLICACGCAYLIISVRKDVSRGVHFEWGKMQRPEENTNCPNIILAAIPMVILFVCYNVFDIGLGYCALISTAVCLLLNFKYISRKKGQNLKQAIFSALSDGVDSAKVMILALPAFGLAALITECPGYDLFIELLSNLPGPPAIAAAIMLILSILICFNPMSGMTFGLTMTTAAYGSVLSADFITRLASFSGLVLDSLPISPGVVSFIEMTDTPLKRGYKHYGICSVLCTAIGTFFLAVLYMLIPGLF